MPDASGEVVMRHEECDGKGCANCDAGYEPIRERPDAETWFFVRAARMAQRGMLPDGGGWAAQRQKTMDAMTLIWNTEAELARNA